MIMGKRMMALIIALAMFMSPLHALGAPSGFDGGVNNEYEYEEIVFITGKPMKFSGELDVKVSESKSGDTETVKYKYNLTNKDETIKTKLTRQITLVTEYTERDDKGQATAQTTLTSTRKK